MAPAVVLARKVRVAVSLVGPAEELPAAEADDAAVVPHVALPGLGQLLADEAVEQKVVIVGVIRRQESNLHPQLKKFMLRSVATKKKTRLRTCDVGPERSNAGS